MSELRTALPRREFIPNRTIPVLHEEVPEANIDEEVKLPLRRRVLLLARDIGIALLIALLIAQFVRPTVVQQHSMEDTLHENDYIFLNRQAYNFKKINRGDIFVFNYNPTLSLVGDQKHLIKRVIGLPGDEVEIKDGNVYVNGKATDESYTKDGFTEGRMEATTVPEGYVFALGDNRQNSLDSRDPTVGMIKMEEIVGKAFFRVLPLSDAGLIK